MALNDTEIQALSHALRAMSPDDELRKQILALRETPFLDPDLHTSHFPDRFLSLAEVRALKSDLVRALAWGVAGLLAGLLTGLAFYWVYAHNPYGYLDHLLLGKPQGGSNWSFWLGYMLGAGAFMAVFWTFLRAPLHRPDPLFGRVLQERLGEKKPLPAHTILSLLRDQRFGLVLERAVDLVLPDPDLPLPGLDPGRTWNPFVDRLVQWVAEDDSFSDLLLGHQQSYVASPLASEINIDPAIRRYLVYVTRKHLFEAIVSDPDFRYIFSGMVHWRKESLRWLATIDFAKAKDLFGSKKEKGEKSSGLGADVQGIANIVLVVLLVITMSGLVNRGSTPETKQDDGKDKETRADLIAAIRTIAESYFKTATDRQSPSTPCPPASPINVMPPNISPATISVQPESIKIPSELSIALLTPPRDPKSGTGSETGSQTVNVGLPSTTPGGGTGGGDGKPPVLPPEPPPAVKTGDEPPAIPPGDTLLKLERGNSFRDLTLQQKGGVSCTYQARLLWEDTRTPHSVTMQVAPPNPAANAASCPRVNGASEMIYASMKPIYNTTLHAYISVETMHRKWGIVGKEGVVILVHPQDTP